MTDTSHNRAEIVRALTALLQPGQVTELRAVDASNRPADRWRAVWSGYYDDPERLADDVLKLTARGVYFVPNKINPDLLARAANRVREVKKDPTTADTDITRRRWLLVDCDPNRAAGISSTDIEHEKAVNRAAEIQGWLVAQGWPAPALADSGNGGHVLARVDLPPDDDGLIERCLHALAARFNDTAVKVDTGVHNPARIWKLYGSLACKGDNILSRPHRLARLLELPADGVVTLAQLEALGGRAPERQAVTMPVREHVGQPFDIQQWAAAHGLALPESKPWQKDGLRWVLPVCPMNETHTDRSAFILQMPSGAISAGCQHESCRSWGWAELRAKYEPARVAVFAPPARVLTDADAPPMNNGAHAAVLDFSPPPLHLTDADAPPPSSNGTHAPTAPAAASVAARLAAVNFVNAAELLTRNFPALKWTIDGILPAGTYILAGRPKVGKSWLALSLAIAVASPGGMAFGKAATSQGDTLYLGLEDSERRLQTRISKLLHADEDGGHAVERLTLVTECPRLNDGGELIISGWLDQKPNARLVVIDTLQRFRPRRKRGGDSYDDDYEALQPILSLTKQRDITVIVVHHLRKMTAGEDVFDSVSGTLGLTGSVDGTLVLQRIRGKSDATLHIVGRDLPEDQELGLEWDPLTASWRLVGDAEELRRTKLQAAIIDALHGEGRPVGPMELHDILRRNKVDMTYDALKRQLSRMAETGLLLKPYEGLYQATIGPRVT